MFPTAAALTRHVFCKPSSLPAGPAGLGKQPHIVGVLGDAAAAHILAAKALLNPARAHGIVDGEAFNISTGRPYHSGSTRLCFGLLLGVAVLTGSLSAFQHGLSGLFPTAVAWMFSVFTLGHIDSRFPRRYEQHSVWTMLWTTEHA